MEFKFNINGIFKNVVSKINYTLLPLDFAGDRRSAQISAAQVADIIDAMGVASGIAQGLQHPITTADKMRNFDHIMYIMVDPENNSGRGSIVGLLKVGVKNLFLYDETGMVHEQKSLCILDFYVHESKQRAGFGKKLYDYMLRDMKIAPCKLAIDKPSEKFLSFLYKHYGLSKIYPQTNNFVLFEGFFNDKNGSIESVEIPETPSRIEKDDRNCFANNSVKSHEYIPTEYGRHTALKPLDTMGKCLEWMPPPKVGRQYHMTPHTSLW